MPNQLTITIAGAGLAGSLLAVLLARRGHRVTLLEARPDPRAAGFKGGRSINLALSTRGIDALDRAGLTKRVLADAVPMPGRMLHEPDGRTVFQPYSADPTDHLNSVSRAGLNVTLLEAADELDNATLLFEHRVVQTDLDATTVTTQTPDGATHSHEADLIVGADGAYSAVRDALRTSDRFDYSQSYLSHGYKELSIPPAESGDFAMAPNALHIWPRPLPSREHNRAASVSSRSAGQAHGVGANMMIALPNADRSFTCTLFWPFEGPDSFEEIDTPEAAVAYFERTYPDAVPLMPTLAVDFARNPVSSLVTVRCEPWARNRTLLIGDAAHAIVPFYGQGMNAAFEDVAALDEAFSSHPTHADVEPLIAGFAAARKPHADAIADLALHNFIEMRDHTASPLFLLKKRAEQTLHRWLPRWFTPLYNMISFTTIPYADAAARARRQARIIAAIGVALVVLIVGVPLLLILALA